MYDLTEWVEAHPGGPSHLIKSAGKDASAVFNIFHPEGTIEKSETLPITALKGSVDPDTLPKVPQGAAPPRPSEDEKKKIPLEAIVGIPDLEAAAESLLPAKAFAYYSAGATSMHTLGLNSSAWDEVLFRPRILVDVANVDTSTEFLGHKTSLPLFVAPAGMASFSHPRGECAIAEAAGNEDIVQFVSTNASMKLEDIIGSAKDKDQVFMMQLYVLTAHRLDEQSPLHLLTLPVSLSLPRRYVNKNRAATEELIKKIHDLKQLKAFFVTVDAAAPGKREADERLRAEVEVASGISGGKIASDKRGGGIGRSVGGFIDPKLCEWACSRLAHADRAANVLLLRTAAWQDVKWLRSQTSLPIGLKGVQTVEDVVKAVEAGVDAVYLSNHGGRALSVGKGMHKCREPALTSFTLAEMAHLRHCTRSSS